MVKMKKISVLVSACVMAASVGSVQAGVEGAVLQQIQGTIMVNQGEAYQAASEGMTLKVGSQLMVLEQGSAILSYADGCAIPVSQDAVVTVKPSSVSCDKRMAAATAVNTKYTQLGEGGSMLPLLLGGAIAAGVLYEVTKNNTPSN